MNISDVITGVLNETDNKRCKRGDLIKKVKNVLAKPNVQDGDIDSVINDMVTDGKLQSKQGYVDTGAPYDKNMDDISIPPKRPVPLPPNVKH